MIPFYEKRSDTPQIFQAEEVSFAAHLHAQLELLYCIDGGVEVTVGDCSHTVHSGDLAVIFPNSLHSYYTLPEEGNRFLLAILPVQLTGPFTNSLLKSHPEDPFIRRNELHQDALYCLRALLCRSQQLDVFGHCIKEPAQKEIDGYQNNIYAVYTQMILCRVLPQLKLVDNTDGNFFDLVYRAVTYVSQHFCSPLSLPMLAQALNVSPFQLSRVFSERLHMGFNEYLNALRVDYARELLRETDLPITQLAFECGFESQRTFNRAFREQTGQSPRQFRKEG